MLFGDDGLERRCALLFLDGDVQSVPSVVEGYTLIDFVTSTNIGDRTSALTRLGVERQRLLDRPRCRPRHRPF